MRKLILLMLASAVAGNANAQTAVKQNRGMIGKISATWCGPCGSWGWDLMNKMIHNNETNAFPISIFPDNRDLNWKNTDFYNATNVALADMITLSGFPSFSANAVDKSDAHSTQQGVDTGAVRADVNAALSAFASAPVVASTGYTYKIEGNKLEVVTKTQFWQAANGTYNVAVYLLEDAMHIQNAQGTAPVQHHGVLRASFSAGVFGEQIATGSVNANQTFDKTFTYTLSGKGLTEWDKTKFHPIVVIWKQNGTKWDYVNGNERYGYVTSVSTLNDISNLAMYPNPAMDQTTIALNLDNDHKVNINMTDAMGRTVYTSGTLQFYTGKNIHQLNTSNLAAGLYNVTISPDNGAPVTQRLTVTK